MVQVFEASQKRYLSVYSRRDSIPRNNMDRQNNSVWVFTGEKRGFPGGVFSAKDVAVRWIANHRLSGTLTKYPVDTGVYDWAVQKGLFSPKRPQHEEPEFIAGFTTASQEHYHFEDGIEGP